MWKQRFIVASAVVIVVCAKTSLPSDIPYEINGELKTYVGFFFGEYSAIDEIGLRDNAIKLIEQKGWTPIKEGSCWIRVSLYDEPACTVTFKTTDNQTQKVSFNKRGQVVNVESTIK
jgi:hypothetical protein